MPDSPQLPRIKLRSVPKQDDFTLIIPVATATEWDKFLQDCSPDAFRSELQRFPATGNSNINKIPVENHLFTISATIQVEHLIHDEALIEGRALICLCNRGEQLSITVRVMCPLKEEAPEKQKNRDRIESRLTVAEATPDPKSSNRGISLPSTFPGDSKSYNRYIATGKDDAFCGFDSLCNVLQNVLFDGKTALPAGLLVISGLTNSGKSLVTRGLIWHILEKLLKKWQEAYSKAKDPRCVHLLTFEDPIETPIFSKSEFPLELDTRVLNSLPLDYTAREWNRDTTGLEQLLQDALRQTPKIVYVGEVRSLEDWKSIFEFAGTGHFIVATTHAGSLTELFTRLFQAVNAKTPADKGMYAQRLFAAINLQNVKAETKLERKATASTSKATIDLECVLPAVWRRSANSVARLISDGLASLLPNRSRSPDADCYGRSYFAAALIAEKSKYYADGQSVEMNKLLLEALRQDLRGE